MVQRQKRLRCVRMCEIINVNDGLGLTIMCILKTFFVREESNCLFLNVINVIGNVRFFMR